MFETTAILILILCLMTFISLRNKSAFFYFYALSLFLVGIIPLITHLLFGTSLGSISGDWYLIITLLIIFFVESICNHVYISKGKVTHTCYSLGILYKMCIITFVIYSFVIISLSLSMNYDGRLDLREQLFIKYKYLIFILNIFKCLGAISVAAILLNIIKLKFPKSSLIFLITLYIILAIVSGDRSYAILILSPLLIYAILNYRTFTVLKKISFVILATILAFLLLGFLHLYRWQTDINIIDAMNYDFVKQAFYFIFENRSSDLFLKDKFIWAINTFPMKYEFIYFNSFTRMVFFIIPGSIAPVYDSMYLYHNAFFDLPLYNISSGVKGSFHPTFYGDLWANGGWSALITLIPFTAIISIFWRQSLKNLNSPLSLVYVSLLPYFLIYTLRGSIHAPFMSLFWAYVAVYSIYFIKFIMFTNYEN